MAGGKAGGVSADDDDGAVESNGRALPSALSARRTCERVRENENGSSEVGRVR